MFIEAVGKKKRDGTDVDDTVYTHYTQYYKQFTAGTIKDNFLRAIPQDIFHFEDRLEPRAPLSRSRSYDAKMKIAAAEGRRVAILVMEKMR